MVQRGTGELNAGLKGCRRAPKQPKRECVKLAIDAALLWQHRRFLIRRSSKEIVKQLNISFFDYYLYRPTESEQRSWHHSLHALAADIKWSKLLDNGLIF